MNGFIIENPDVVWWAMRLMGSTICLLFIALIFFMKLVISRLTRAIESLEQAFSEEKKDIGSIKDRLQKQETTCEMQRAQCPNRVLATPIEKIFTGRHIESPGQL